MKTMLVYADLYVTERLIEWGIDNKMNLSLFSRLIEEYQSVQPDMMKYRLQSKTNVNFLLNYIDWKLISEEKEADPVGFCDMCYNSLLYQEFDSSDPKSPTLEFTELASSLKVIAKDPSVDTMCIYTEYDSSFIREKILDFFLSPKVKIITGNKEQFLKTHTFDSYFFEDVDDTQYIKRWHNQRSEVIIPAFPFNVEGYDIVDNKVVYSQDSLCKIPILDTNPVEYLTKYNLDIGLVDIPL